MKIEKDIPMPTSKYRGGKHSFYGFDSFEVGDSILIIDPDRFSKARQAARKWNQRHESKFTSRTVPEGIRIWRIS